MAWASLIFAACLSGASALMAGDCATCHPSETKLHLQSAHASALMAPAESMFFRRLPDNPLGEAADGYLFEYSLTPDGVSVIVERGSDRATAPVVWVFGAGRQGQTPVIKYQGKFIEHRVSLYTARGYGLTIGNENGVSESAIKALGLVQSDADARTCFNCHATSIGQDLTRLTPGVQCIRCHAGAEEHARGHGMPVNPGALDHVAQVQLCGECHRLKAPPGDESDIASVRFQPFRLMMSACYLKGKIECTTCHPAHSNAQRDSPKTYSHSCLSCHQNEGGHIVRKKSENCLGCHMPRVNPAPGFTFTDHFIRVLSDSK
jgi:Cytochrome c554 and c-prime